MLWLKQNRDHCHQRSRLKRKSWQSTMIFLRLVNINWHVLILLGWDALLSAHSLLRAKIKVVITFLRHVHDYLITLFHACKEWLITLCSVCSSAQKIIIFWNLATMHFDHCYIILIYFQLFLPHITYYSRKSRRVGLGFFIFVT